MFQQLKNLALYANITIFWRQYVELFDEDNFLPSLKSYAYIYTKSKSINSGPWHYIYIDVLGIF